MTVIYGREITPVYVNGSTTVNYIIGENYLVVESPLINKLAVEDVEWVRVKGVWFKGGVSQDTHQRLDHLVAKNIHSNSIRAETIQ